MYKPTLLHDARVEVTSMHPMENIPPRMKNDIEFERFIRRIAKLDIKEIKKEALILTERDIKKIVGYMPYNDFNIKLENFFEIYKFRAKFGYAKYLFTSWLESFDKYEFNHLAVKYLLKEPYFVDYLKSINLNKDIFLQWLTADNIPYFVGRFAYEHNNQSKNFADSLECYGVPSTSQLFLQSESLFYTYCNSADYLNCNVLVLTDIIQKYDEERIRLFIHNFVGKLTIGDLLKYNELLKIITGYTSEIPYSDTFCSFFENESKDIVEKYIDWLNSHLITRIFGNDDRGRFWSKFRFKATPKRFKTNGTVVMRLNGYVALEFVGVGAIGPIYFYTYEYYENKIKNWVEIARYTSVELRSKLYADYNEYYNEGIERVTHQGDWEYTVERFYLIRYGMTERLNPHRRF